MPVGGELRPLRAQAWRADLPWSGGGQVSRGFTTTDDFSEDFGVSEHFGLFVFRHDGDQVFKTYSTNGRGVEALGPLWSLLDVTPSGRQEEEVDSPEGWPQTPPYQWGRRRDEYDDPGNG